MPLSIETGPVRSAITTPLVVVSVIFPVLSLGAIILRYLALRKARQELHADDVWAVVAWIFTFALSVLVWVFTAKSGINFYKIDPLQGTEDSLEMIFLASCLIQFPLATIKISILLFYKRIFQTRIFQICVWLAIGLVTIWGIVFFALVLTQVDPISASWTGGRLRYDSAALGVAQVSSSFALDFVVLCFPLPVISSLHMAPRRKLGVVMIFWLGAFCMIAAIIRTIYLNESIRAVTGVSQNLVFLQSKQFIFLILEPNCSVIAACLPTYGPLLAGGRSPASLVRSVRSALSLRSLGSGRGSKKSQDASGKSRIWANSGTDLQAKTDSEIELNVQEWPGKGLPMDGQQDVNCAHDAQVPRVPDTERGINVTKSVSVTNGHDGT